jgi:mannose-6-phosphate isomerase-like protein (cupin superfamily)
MRGARNRRVLFAGIALAAVALAVSPAPGPTPATLDALFPSGRLTLTLDALAAKYPLPPGKEFQVDEVGRDAHSSQHVVWIVDREVPHRHDTHDLFVVMVRGYGTMRLGAEKRPVGQGSILYVPRGTPHAFANESGEPALAYAVYFPAFDGKDRVTVD